MSTKTNNAIPNYGEVKDLCGAYIFVDNQLKWPDIVNKHICIGRLSIIIDYRSFGYDGIASHIIDIPIKVAAGEADTINVLVLVDESYGTGYDENQTITVDFTNGYIILSGEFIDAVNALGTITIQFIPIITE